MLQTASKKVLACPDHSLIILYFSISTSAFLFVSSLKLKILEGGDKLFVQHAHHGLAPHPESAADAIVVIGKLLLPPLGAVSHAVQGWHLSQISSAGFSSCSTPDCFLTSAHSPFQTYSLLCFHLSPVFCLPLEFLSICLSTVQSPCSHHSWLTKSPTHLCHLLVSSPALLPCCIPTSLGSPASLFSLSTDSPHTHSLLISWNTDTSLTDGNENIWEEEWGIRQDPLSSTIPLAPAVPDKSIKIPWAALGFKLPQQEHSTVIPNSYRPFCVLRQEVLCVYIKTLSFKTWISHYHTQMWEVRQDLLLFQIMT